MAYSYEEIKAEKYLKQDCLVITFRRTNLGNASLIKLLENELDHLMEKNKRKHIVFDFTGVKIAPSAVLGLVLQVVADARKEDCQTRLCCLAPSIRKAFEIIGTEGFADIYDTLPHAINTPWKKKKRWWFF